MPDIILAGINLMVMGMGAVFVFLILLVVGTTLMSKIILALPGGVDSEAKARPSSRINNQEDLAEIAAVAAIAKAAHAR